LILPDARILECVTIGREREEPQALQWREGYEAGVRLTVTLGSQHSEQVPLKHGPDGLLNLAGFLCHAIYHAIACSSPPDDAATLRLDFPAQRLTKAAPQSFVDLNELSGLPATGFSVDCKDNWNVINEFWRHHIPVNHSH